eukprot:8165973-Ditylum_brightwellii.AAC.1
MAALDDSTHSLMNGRPDLFNDGVGLLWVLRDKFQASYNVLSFWQAVKEFEGIQCKTTNYDFYANIIATMRADLAWNQKTFLDEEVKSIFIEGLGEEFDFFWKVISLTPPLLSNRPITSMS